MVNFKWQVLYSKQKLMLVGGLIAVAIIVPILIGESESSNDGNSGGVDSSDGEKCAGCAKARRKWKRWSRWKKAAMHSWWVYKKIQCKASGCDNF